MCELINSCGDRAVSTCLFGCNALWDIFRARWLLTWVAFFLGGWKDFKWDNVYKCGRSVGFVGLYCGVCAKL